MSSDWISDRLKQREAVAARSVTIARGLDTLWRNLCAAIEALTLQYTRECEGEKAEWSGHGPETIWARVGLMQRSRTPEVVERNRVTVKLDRKEEAVAYRYTKPYHGLSSGKFSVGVNGEGQACFMDGEARPISIEDVARRIMEPLLFSDLPPL